MSDIKLEPIVKTPSRNTADTAATKNVRGTRDGTLFTADWLTNLALQGRIYVCSDADQNDVVVGATSFATTTPTFLLDVPAGTAAIPLFVQLVQAGSVAGAAIDVLIEFDNAARYTSGGTNETTGLLSTRTDQPLSAKCKLYSTGGSAITATDAYGTMLKHILAIPQDVAPAITEVYNWHQIEWHAPFPILLVGPAAFLVYTYAGTTGPSWNWSVGWAELPSSDLT